MTKPATLARKRLFARAALWWEGAWPAASPVLGVVGLFMVFALLGVPAVLPVWLHLVVLLGFLAGLGWTLRRAVRGFRPPGAPDADRRLERDSGLSHRPLAALQDRPATQDSAGLALWQAHQRRMAALIGRLRVGHPRPGLAARDRMALRGGLVVALGAALVMAGADAPALLLRGVTPVFAAGPPPAPLRVEAWVTPPAYTGAPPIFLDAATAPVTAPLGSRVQVALSGGSRAEPEITGLPGAMFAPLGGGSHSAQGVLDAPARITIRQDGRDVAGWNIGVRADAPPRVAFTETPTRAPRGLALRLPWLVEDDWGVVALRAELHLAHRPEAPPIELDIALPSPATREAQGLSQPDFSAHPWAGLDITLQLIARDGADQKGLSETVTLTLPERSFNHPVARAMIEVRKGLSRDPSARGVALRVLNALATDADAFENDIPTYLALRLAGSILHRDRREDSVAEAQGILWEAALALEEGRDSRTAAALAEAQRALREALAEAERTPENEAERAQAQERIQELREAIRRHLEAMADRLQQENAEAMPYDPQQRMLDQRDMDRRTRRMEEATRDNRMQDAQREMADLEEMLRALQEGRVARGEPPERQRQRERGQQQMGAVQDMVRRQTTMLDHGQRRAEQEDERQQQERRALSPWHHRPTSPGQRAPEANAQARAEAEAEAHADARMQRALRRALGELMQQYGDLTGEVPQAMGQADQAMREAMEALSENRDARPAQQEAIQRLQEGGRQMAQQMQRQFGQGQGQGEGRGDGDGDSGMGGEFGFGGEGPGSEFGLGEGRDPLGRPRDSAGTADHGSDTRVPDEAELLRTRRLQEELRRRGAERERPVEELDYIDRLLRRF